MIDLKERPRRFKRKFSGPLDVGGIAVRPKETILDMSVSKLAKAKTQVNLEPSLRKTVMIVNTIRKIEQEIENDETTTVSKEMCVDYSNRPNTRPSNNNCEDRLIQDSEESTNSFKEKPVRLGVSLTKRNKQSGCGKSSEVSDNNRYRSFGVATSEEIDLKHRDIHHHYKNKTNKRLIASYNSDLPLLEKEEINFAEIDISLYDFDDAWTEGGLHLASCGGNEFEDNDNIYKTNTGLSALIRRCSSDLKFTKSTENSLTDDLDQIMQVLVGI